MPIHEMTKEEYESAVASKDWLTAQELMSFYYGYYNDLVRRPDEWTAVDRRVLANLFQYFLIREEAWSIERSILATKLNAKVFDDSPETTLDDAVITVEH